MSSDKNIICGPKVEFKPYTKGIGEYFFDLTKKYAANICQTFADTGVEESYGDIRTRAIRLAINIQKLGASANTSIIVICNIESLIAKLKACLEHLTIPPTLIVIGDSDEYCTLNSLSHGCAEEDSFRPKEIANNEDIAIIVLSSGTTGPPKGICFSHYCFPNLVINALGYDGTPFKETLLTFIYTAAISGICTVFFLFNSGSHRIIEPNFEATKVLQLVEKYKISYLYIGNVELEAFLSMKDFDKYDTSSLKFVSSGGENLSPTCWRDLKVLFKHSIVFRQYGLTETASNGCNFGYENPLSRKVDSVGLPMRNIELKVVDRKSGETVGARQIGEIRIKSPFRMTNYLKRPDLEVFDEDGFFKSGDVGYYDEDECFYYLCRIADIIRYKEHEVYHTILENILKQLPAVKEVAVFGVPDKDDGYHPAACVVFKENHSMSAEDIHKYVSEHAEDWQALRGGIKFVANLPRSVNRKIRIKELLDIFLKAQ